MKNSIAMTLVITAGIFSFVSGYSIGNHPNQGSSYNMNSQQEAAKTASNTSAPAAGGYGAPADTSSGTGSSSPGYGDSSPGYSAPSPGYGK